MVVRDIGMSVCLGNYGDDIAINSHKIPFIIYITGNNLTYLLGMMIRS